MARELGVNTSELEPEQAPGPVIAEEDGEADDADQTDGSGGVEEADVRPHPARPSMRNPASLVREAITSFNETFDKRRIESFIREHHPQIPLNPNAVSNVLNKLRKRGEIKKVREESGRQPAKYIKEKAFQPLVFDVVDSTAHGESHI